MSREKARQLAHEAIKRGQPLAWFEELYSLADSANSSAIPWADLTPNPNLIEWLNHEPVEGPGKQALIVGCGLGDDAEELARRGFDVVAFDVSPSAIDQARSRFTDSAVSYQAVDLFQAPVDWDNRFDLVVESYTLQVLPPDLRNRAVRQIASFITPGGRLLVIARARSEDDDAGQMPWPLTRSEMDRFVECGLRQARFEDYFENEDPPVRRFRAVYDKP